MRLERGGDRPVKVPAEIMGYCLEVAGRLERVLEDQLAAVYLSGSVAQGDFAPATSDVDIKCISVHSIDEATRDEIVEALRHEHLACPARLLELTLLTAAAAMTPTDAPPYELDLNTGPGRFRLNLMEGDVEPHWFVLDAEVTRRDGIALHGPDPSEMFGAVPRSLLLHAQLAELEWYAVNEAATYQRVLQACRALAHAEDDLLLAKGPAARWALRHGEDDRLIEDALSIREGKTLQLDPARIDDIARHARIAVEGAIAEGGAR